MKTNLFLAAVAVLSLTAVGCSGEKNIAVEKVSLSSSSLSLKTGEEAVLTAVITPENATNTNVVWKSGNPAKASVTDGVVKGLSEGSSTISAMTEDGGFTAYCLVFVSDYHAESVAITPAEDRQMKKGESFQLSATVSPDNAIDKNVTWSSSDTGVATVDASGKVTATGGGEATVTVTTVDGEKTASVKIYVTVPCTGIALSESGFEIYEGLSHGGIVLTFTPEDCSDKEIEWSYDSSIIAVAIESDGTVTVTGILEGETTLKATSKDGGFTAECKVKVLAKGTIVPGDDYGRYE
jgi:uncharacterized protein YjdB